MAILDGNYWFSGTSGDAPLPIADIGQSLRGRGPGTGRLARTPAAAGNRQTYTISFWLKYAGVSNSQALYAAERFHANTGGTVGQFAGNAGAHDPATNLFWNVGATRFRDPSAWYHWVFVGDTTNATEADRIRLYINGERITISGSIGQNYNTGWNAAVTTTIFDYADTSDAGNSNFQGYLADFYNIDGQALEPTAFGLYDEQGVWVPREVDFTPTTPRYSDFLTAEGGGAFNNAATRAFDGSTATGSTLTNSTGFMRFAPVPAIEGITSVRAFVDTNVDIEWQGVTTNNNGTLGWQDVTGTGTISASQPMDFVTNNASFANLRAIEITDANGTRILTDPFLWSSGVTLLGANAGQGFQPGEGPAQLFDGSTATQAHSVGTNVVIKWEPSTSIPYNNTVEVYSKGATGTQVAYVDDTDGTIQNANATQNQWAVIANGPGTIESVRMSGINNDAYWSAVRIDGQIYVDGTNASYGTNGFHLDFADPNDLGADRSGNGNDFTATGFNTDPVGIFSNDLFTYQASQAIVDNGPSAANLASTDKVFDAGSPATNGFDGNPGVYALSDNTGLAWVWRPSTPIENVTQIDVRGLSGQPVYINGTVSATRLNDAQQTIYSGAAITLETLSGLPATAGDVWLPAGSAGFGAIWINGTIFVDNTGTDYDLMQDSPSQNFATQNPISTIVLSNTGNFGTNLSDANLTSTGDATGHDNSLSNFVIPDSGTWYAECTVVSTGSIGIGVVSPDTWNAGIFNDTSYVYREDGQKYHQPNGVQAYGDTYTTGDIIGVQFNSNTNELSFYKNGVSQGVAYTVSTAYRYCFQNYRTNYTVAWNYGQRPFIHQPAGTTALQTQKLPSASIPNGTDHFRALTATGASILSVAQGNLNGYFGAAGFANGLWWIKSLTNPDGQINQHQISNSVLPADSWGHLPGNFNAFEAYQTPVSDSVAWCWSGDNVTGADLTAVNANGDLDLTGLVRNVDAGMSSGYYNGSPDGTEQAAGTELSFPHGLSQAPEFVAVTLMDDNGSGSTNTWQVYSSSPDARADRGLILRSNDSGFSPDFFWTTEQEATTDTLIRIRVAPSALVSNDLNRRRTCGYDSNYFFMAFHSVPGYSAFGSYTGNGDPDGPFIYTGFKPAFILTKRSSDVEDWSIVDTTRSINNPAFQNLRPNQINGEGSGAGSNDIDFLSNGFKLRNNTDRFNGSGSEYIYAAFASNPFGGSNVNPVPAALAGPPQIDGIVPGIGKSLRFKGGQYLINTSLGRPTGDFTLSFWLKSATTNTDSMGLYCANTGVNDGYNISSINSNPPSAVRRRNSGGFALLSDGVLRDPAAWYHLVFQSESDVTTLFINGVQQTNTASTFPASSTTIIGAANSNVPDEAFSGLLADFYCIDGQVLEPAAFGEYNDDNIWVPIDPTITDYGTNGFKLVMDPAYQTGTTLADQSGNGNDFTMSGFDTDDYFSADFDFMKDGPSQNYATYNPLPTVPTDFANSNLTETNSGTSAWEQGNGSQVITGGKWYFEATAIGADSFGIGFGDQRWDPNQNDVFIGQQVGSIGFNGANGNVHLNGSAFAYGNTYSVGDVVQVAADMDNDLIWFGINGTWQSSATQAEIEAGDGTNAAWNAFNANYYQFITVTSDTGGNAGWDANFGQQPFQFTQPAGFSALQTQNLPAATITDGRDHFQALTGPGGGRLLFEEAGASTGPTDALNPISNGAVLPISGSFTSTYIDWGSPLASISVQYTGSWTAQHVVLSEDGATWTDLGAQTLTGTITYTAAQNGGNNIRYIRWWNSPATTMAWAAGTTGGTPILQVAQATFANGLWLIKDRKSSGTQFQTVDSVTNAALGGDFANTMPTISQAIAYANPALDCVAWCWNSANPATSGFNIVQYTGQNPTTTAVAHGLGVAPDLIWTQAKSGTARNYAVYHSALGEGKWMELNSSAAAVSDATMWNNQAPDATNFYVGAANTTNFPGAVYTAYCWRAVPGYSAFGSYQSNVQSDGPFVYTGFRPALVITCNADQSTTVGFNPKDSTRQPDNLSTGLRLAFNQDAAETTHANEAMDFLSNGFKIRGTSDSQNAPDINKEFVWMAWAENPFGGSNTVPVTAR